MTKDDFHGAALTALGSTLNTSGIDAGLAFLNARVPHRCTGVYHLEGLNIRAVNLFDKQGLLLPDMLGTVPLKDSFCDHAIRDGEFATTNSTLDERADSSAMKGIVIAYCGIPLLDRQGKLFGSLCHFNYASATLPPDEFEFTQKAAQLLAQYL